MPTPANGNRVTTAQLYEMMIEQHEQRHQMELRIIGRIDEIMKCFPALQNQVSTHKDEIEKLRTRGDRWDSINTLIAIVGSAISGWIGTRQ